MRSLLEVVEDIKHLKELYNNSEDDSPEQDYAVRQIEALTLEAEAIQRSAGIKLLP